MDEVEVKRAMLKLSEILKEIEDTNTRNALIIVTSVLIEHNKAITDLVEAGEEC